MHRGATKTQNDLIKFQFALPADVWIIQLVPEGENGRPIRDFIPKLKLFSTEQVSWFRARNANGCHIYGRPNSTRFILIDDVKQDGLDQMIRDGLTRTVVIETSPDNFQVWIAVSDTELPVPVATQLAKLLERRYSTDQGSADAFHLGRLPGLRNKKAKYRADPNDGGPLVRLHLARDVPKIPDGIGELIEEAERLAANRPSTSSSSALGACAPTDIDPSRSPMTPSEAREFYDAEAKRLAELFDWHLPIRKGGRSEADYHIARGLYVQYGFDPDDIAAVLLFASAKAEEKGLHALDYVMRTVGRAVRPYRPFPPSVSGLT